MTKAELLAEFRDKGRVRAPMSLFSEVVDAGQHSHHWRVIVCDSKTERDVCECSKCGVQREFACDFDEEYS